MSTDQSRQSKPTTILTGFLGAGKTTYLNHLLESKPDRKYAIIENEYGEQSIDSDLILRAEDDIVELNNGCLCCTLNDNLYDILNTLFDRRSEYDEIIIEATGVANPVGLAEPFIVHPAIKKQFPLTRIVCLVDAELIEDHLEETEEAITQITFSDVLLVNKTDLVSNEYLQELQQKLQKLNPLAKVVFGNKDDFPKIDSGVHNPAFDDLHLKSKVENHHSVSGNNFPVHKPHAHHHHDHTEEVVSQTFVFDKPFNYETLYHQLMVYLTFQSKGLYRMKGIVSLEDSDKKYIIQSVGKRLSIDEKSPWKADEKKISTIVFIGKNLQRAGLEKMLNRCISK